MRIWNLTLLMLGGCLLAAAQDHGFRFSHLSIRDGLSHNQINCFLRDPEGFMWIGTSSGLNRFDGYECKVYRNDPSDTTSLISSNVLNLSEGPNGKVWVYTYFGNCIYDPSTESFVQNVNRLLREYTIPDGPILAIHKDHAGRYWFLHQFEGLYRFDPELNTAIRVRNRPGHPIYSFQEDSDHNYWIIFNDGLFEKIDGRSLEIVYRNDELQNLHPNDAFVYNIRSDSDNDLWIYVNNQDRGVYFFDVSAKKLEHYTTTSTKFRLRSNIVKSLVTADDGLVWIGTDHGGLNLISKNKQSVQYLLHNEADNTTVSENSINALYRDEEGFIWAGTFKEGVSYYHDNLIRFDRVRNQPGNPQSLPYNDINRFVEDKEGNLWLGTNGRGLIYYNRQTGTYKQYLHDPNNSNSLAGDVIVSMYMDSQDKLWIGMYYAGLDCFDGRRFIHYRHDPADRTTISDNSPWEILEDSKGNLWVGTLVGGLNKLDRATGKFTRYSSADGIKTGYIPALMEARDGTLWVGTGFGINFLKPGATTFEHYLSAEGPDELSNNSVICMMEDTRGLVWIGTQDGLNLYNPRTGKYKVYRQKDGLPDNTILNLVEDEKGDLWMSSPNGISHVTLTGSSAGYTLTFRNYDESDGLQGRFFNENASLRTKRGEILFGGPDGYNIVRPEMVALNSKVPPVRLIGFQLYNRSVAPGDTVGNRVLFTHSIGETESITLNHSDNVFSITFAALSFFHPEKNVYKYKLEGFNDDWLLADNQSRTVTFTNLDPGTYTFRVIAANNDGLWNEEGAQLKITVLPPFWKTRTAFFLYTMGILLVLYFARRTTLRRLRLKYQIEQERREAQKTHELDMLKIRFFTNVSHEFRTPLTLIMTPLERLIKSGKYNKEQSHFNLMHRNARRLLNLVNQLLDFRRMEVQEVKLSTSEGDIIKYIKEVVYSFSDLSEKKNIRLTFHSDIESLETFFDQNKIERILFNLLSNAFKFTPIDGAVKVEIETEPNPQNPEKLIIRVSDTGIGIPKEVQDKIFDRFFQSDVPSTLVNQGSGIGLSITKEFVRLHGGTIAVESEVDKGSTFTVIIPLQSIHEPKWDTEQSPADPILPSSAEIEEDNERGQSKKSPVILLVEDNDDFRFYLKDNLKQSFQILEATNGSQGWEQALHQIPDLIVSDIMMPEMDGISLCRKIKHDPRTSHIPVILLTARAAEDQKIEGFKAGADDYVTKPFNFEILLARIRNRIALRHAMHKTFHHQIEVKASEIAVSSLDEKLIEKALKIVEANLAEPDFSVENLSHELGMSRVHLYKKLLSITGKTPIEFIRTIRLQHAAQLLEKSQLTVAEIAYKVGFNNPKYFARYFRDQYDMLPSAYANKKKYSQS